MALRPYAAGRRLLVHSALAGFVSTILGLAVAITFIVVPLEPEQQAFLALGGFLCFLIANRLPGRGVTLFLIFFSGAISLRYLYWRVTDTLDYASFFQTFLGTGLLLAEGYAILALLLSYFQQAWPLERKPAPMPEDSDLWPTVDILIPTYNEPLSVVKPAVFAAMAIDWPRDKMRVLLLDDGRREEFQQFAANIGCEYLTRPDNKGAKAGNINNALAQTDGEYVAVFDCDHVATRGFLQFTVGWLLRDRDLAMVQTPHHFYSPDPFERNLASGQRVPNEGLLFYGLIQQGNDLWNAAFFCGSCAVMRRVALEEVGGVPTQTVTEDCHCSLKMQRLGWRTAYLRVPLAAGLATERLILHIGQRMRWARGMVQILRIETPLFSSGLRLAQRLCYFNAQLHFLFPLPRVVFLTAPLAFLLFGESVIAASPLAIVAFAGPHVLHSIATASRIQGGVRHSFWSEIYETVLALYLLPVVLTTLLDPSKGKFNVTDKGGTLQEGYFDLRAVAPNVVLGVLLIIGLLSGIHGLATNAVETTQFQANALNTVWVLLSLITVLAGLAVGRERRQVRERARIGAVVAATVVLPDGRVVQGHSLDLSLGGAAIAVALPADMPPDAVVTLELDVGPERIAIPAEVLRWSENRLQVRFLPQDLRDEGNIVRSVLGRADAWVDWDSVRRDRPLRSLKEVAVSIGGLFRGDSQFSFRGRRERRAAMRAARGRSAAVHVPDVVIAESTLPEGPPTQPNSTAAAERARRRMAAGIALLLGLWFALPAEAQRQQAPPPPPPFGSPPVPGQAPFVTPQPPVVTQQQYVVPGDLAPTFVPPAFAPPPGATSGVPPGTGGIPGAALPGYAGGPLPLGGADASGTSRVESRTLRQLGLRGPMQMRGLSDLQGLLFGVRGDEVVTAARLVVQGATSPALIPELSQIAFTLNEQFVGTITPDRTRPAFGPLEFPINPVFFADSNRLNFRFTGRYAVECNDPLSGLLWSTISDLSTLHLTLERLPLARDLARLPEPFFDPRLLREPLVLPMVVPDGAGNEVIKAATIVSSWFAVQADYRGANFPVSAAIPTRGNAVVIATGQDSVPGLALPRLDGPTLSLAPNPNDANGLLLIIGGRSGAEAVLAAEGLAIGRAALSGETALVQQTDAPPRQPYDAPRWLRSDRPVRIGELMDVSELQSYGFAPGPISVPFRNAPDLYTFRGRNLETDIRFRAPPGPIMDVAVSRVDVALNDVYLRSFPLGEPEQAWPWNQIRRWVGAAPGGERGEGHAGLPPYLIFGLNELQLRFDMRPLNRGDCVSIPGDIHASIDPDSTIDISRAFRFTAMPNLAFFAGSGFPFSRLADLGDTAAVLPDRPNALELTAFFNMIGRMAANVGHPATRIEIVRSAALESVADRNLLVFGVLGRQPALTTLFPDGPVVMEPNGRTTVGLPDALETFRQIFLPEDRRRERDRLSAVLAQPGDGVGMFLSGESPLRSNRTVVAVTGTNPQGLEAIVASLRDPELQPRIQGDVSILSGGRMTSYMVGSIYHVGALPWWLAPQYWLGKRPDLLLLALGIAALLIAIPSYWALRRRAALRLRTRTP